MSSPDYRALCAELLSLLDDIAMRDPEMDGGMLRHRARTALAQPDSIEDRIAKADAAIEASMERIRTIAAPARAALAQPEPVAPTDEELITMWATTSYIDQPEGGLAYARAVLARWGRPANTINYDHD
jgi:hypothetical protein